MPRIRVDNVGDVGIIKDVPSYELPANAWSDGKNVRMQDGSVHKAKGYTDLFANPLVPPYALFPVGTSEAFYWIYCGLSKVYAIQTTTSFDITRSSGDYNANEYYRWNGDSLGGVIVLNNGVDVPQFWSFPVNHTNPLQDLTAWPSTDRCRVMRAYKNFLIAGNISRSSVAYPNLVKWSHSADLGSEPSSWDITDPTLDAGEVGLAQTGGDILDMRVLRDINVLYRADSTWAMQSTGGSEIFRFWAIFETSGILGLNCVAEWFGRHFVVTQDDVIVHDGQTIISVADQKMRQHFFGDIDSTNYDRAFVVHHRREKEMWVCYPGSGSTFADRAWVWNYAENTWAHRDIPNATHGAYGVIDEDALDVWNPASGNDIAWGADTRPWNYRTYDSQKNGILLSNASDEQLFQGDDSNTAASATLSASITRLGLSMIGPEKTDLYSRKHVRAIYPHVEGTDGGIIKVRCGGQDAIDGAVTWADEKPYTIGTDYKVDFNVDARLIAVEFSSTRDIEWRLHGYQIDLEVSGDR
jgi:hypothetical protein